MYKCKSCGGDLIYNIKDKDMECTSCNSHFPVDTYKNDKPADEKHMYETTVYTCTQCGAELTGSENSAVAFCSYCGTEAVLEGRISRQYRPDHIIPFKKTKKDCRDRYLKKVKSEPYAPREFRDPKFIDRFRGIYIPYWEYDVVFNNEPSITVKEEYSTASYDYSKEYRVIPKLKDRNIVISCDASSGFDDEIAAEIAPFSRESLEPFNPAYLAGFFADTSDVPREVYSDEVVVDAQERVVSDIRKGFKHDIKVELSDDYNKRTELFGTWCKSAVGSLYPVWFLTWRKGKRLAYGVVNGETGKISAQIPVDISRFLMVSGIIAVVVFVLLTLMGTLIMPPSLLVITVLAALVAQVFYLKEITAIRDKERNINNIGALKGEEQAKAKKERVTRRIKGKADLTKLLWIILIASVPFLFIFLDGPFRAVAGCFGYCCIGAILFFRTLKPIAGIKEKGMFLGALLPFAAEVVAMVIAIMTPVNDWVYYIGTLSVMGAVIFTCLSMIFRYNLLTTRSIPDFHDRKGGNADAGR